MFLKLKRYFPLSSWNLIHSVKCNKGNNQYYQKGQSGLHSHPRAHTAVSRFIVCGSVHRSRKPVLLAHCWGNQVLGKQKQNWVHRNHHTDKVMPSLVLTRLLRNTDWKVQLLVSSKVLLILRTTGGIPNRNLENGPNMGTWFISQNSLLYFTKDLRWLPNTDTIDR